MGDRSLVHKVQELGTIIFKQITKGCLSAYIHLVGKKENEDEGIYLAKLWNRRSSLHMT